MRVVLADVGHQVGHEQETMTRPLRRVHRIVFLALAILLPLLLVLSVLWRRPIPVVTLPADLELAGRHGSRLP